MKPLRWRACSYAPFFAMALVGCVCGVLVETEEDANPGGMCEVPEWIVVASSGSADTELIDSFVDKVMLPGSAISPKLAAGIAGNVFNSKSAWKDFPMVRMFVGKDAYICMWYRGDAGSEFNELIALPSSVAIRASDGAVFDKVINGWRRMGYVHEVSSIICKNVVGRKSSEILREWGVPYKVSMKQRQLDGITSCLWWGYLQMDGSFSMEKDGEQPDTENEIIVSEEVLMGRLESAEEGSMLYLCLDRRVVVTFKNGLCQTASEEGRDPNCQSL